METSSNQRLIIPAVIVAAGIALAAWLLGEGLLKFKSMDRTITVKGLAQMEVKADTAIWPIRFKDAANELEPLVAGAEKKTQAVVSYLKQQGFTDEEISVSSLSVVDKLANEYSSGNNPGFRYVVTSNITVYTNQPDKVSAARAQMGQLAKQNIVIAQDRYEGRVQYLFTGLNDIKPAMVEQATHNARTVAEKFAADSDSRLGKIRTARQGQFSINDRDSNTPQIKKVRVVSTLEYYLVD